MASLVTALDNYTPKQTGEKGHIEYGWSNNIQEKILQFSFQLTRTTSVKVQYLSVILKDMLKLLKNKMDLASSFSSSIQHHAEINLARGYLSVLYKMIGQTRDIIDGKGEYTLAYMMIYTWYEFYPKLALFALRCMVDLGDEYHQYGSWKDIKYFCSYCKLQNCDVSHPLILYSIELINKQLKKDVSDEDNISLLAKWVPRETSSFGWLYESLACDYFSQFIETAHSDEQIKRAIKKCKTQYRKLLSDLNRKIDTTQIKQCGQDWSNIDFNKVTSITVYKQKNAFLNITKNRTVRFENNQDRIECAENFKQHIQKAILGDFDIKGKRLSMSSFTKEALEIITRKNNSKGSVDFFNIAEDIDFLDSQWRDSSKLTGCLNNMIAMVDVSSSMDGEPMNTAIALGIRIAEKSSIGQRVLTFSAKPSWVNLEHHDGFFSKVEAIDNADWGMNTNFHAALDVILDAIIQNKMTPEDVQDMVLVVLSDMQIDQGDSSDKIALYEVMQTKYAAAGIRVHGSPYKPPHILFWNLRSTTGFPCVSKQQNCSMISGFSPSLLNLFCEKGLDAFESCTPWYMLEHSLNTPRYKIMSNMLEDEM